jgi:hypothetical protein
VKHGLLYPAEVLEIIETIFARINGLVLWARLDAVKGGSFGVETWHMGPPVDGQS